MNRLKSVLPESTSIHPPPNTLHPIGVALNFTHISTGNNPKSTEQQSPCSRIQQWSVMKSTQQWSIGGTTFKFSNICVVCLFSRAQRNCQSLAVCHDDNLTTWLMGMGIVALGTVQNSCCGYVRCCCCCCDSLRDEKGILTVLSNNSWMEKQKSLHICCCFFACAPSGIWLRASDGCLFDWSDLTAPTPNRMPGQPPLCLSCMRILTCSKCQFYWQIDQNTSQETYIGDDWPSQAKKIFSTKGRGGFFNRGLVIEKLAM